MCSDTDPTLLILVFSLLLIVILGALVFLFESRSSQQVLSEVQALRRDIRSSEGHGGDLSA